MSSQQHPKPAADSPILPAGRTRALLLTDMVRSTALWEELGGEFPAILDLHHAVLRAEFQRHGGEELNEAGDGFVVAFDDPLAAARCAVAAQQALMRAVWPGGRGPVGVRMALHYGTVERIGENYRGFDLHHASRLLGLAREGQVLCSATIAPVLMRNVPPRATLRDLGEFRLRDIVRAERIFLLHIDGSKAPTTIAAAAPTRQVSLPTALTRFFGRKPEIETLLAWLGDGAAGFPAADGSRLVTLTGPGGTGKTRLAMALAERVAARPGERVFFVSLAGLSDARFVIEAIGETLRGDAGERGSRDAGAGSVLDQVTALLAAGPALLLLDNFEQLVEAGAGVIQELLARVPTLRCVVTSRLPLALAGEREFPVTPLRVPDRTASSESLAACESVQLFGDRARAVRPDFLITAQNVDAVAEICRQLDGLPLAIELAAARVQMLTPREIQTRLGRSLDFLVATQRDVAPRHRTLRAAVDWSYELLPEKERNLFARLAVFRGGFTLEAAARVGLDGEVAADDEVFEPLCELRKFSLVFAEQRGETTRYRLLEPLRQYAGECLEHAGAVAAAATRARHRDYFFALAMQAEPEMKESDQGRWLEIVDAEHDNFRVLLGSKTEPAAARLRLAVALHRFWLLHGDIQGGRVWIEQALAETGTASEWKSVRAKGHNAAGVLAWAGGDMEAARAGFACAVELFRELHDLRHAVFALNNLAIVASEREDFAAARQWYESALEMLALPEAQATEDPDAQRALVLSNLGRVLLVQGAFAEARARLEESLRLSRDRFNVANILTSLGEVEAAEGDLRRAHQRFLASLAIRQEIGYRNNATFLHTLASISLHAGAVADAGRLLAAAASAREALGIVWEVHEESRFAAGLAAVRETLSPTEFAAVWQEGERFTLADVMDFCERQS